MVSTLNTNSFVEVPGCLRNRSPGLSTISLQEKGCLTQQKLESEGVPTGDSSTKRIWNKVIAPGEKDKGRVEKS